MPKKNTNARYRTEAFERQNGRCIYCDAQMWLGGALAQRAFGEAHGIRPRAARAFKATAEHLVPRQNGGRTDRDNIAAACRLCNMRRHRRKWQLTPEQFRAHVQRRLAAGRWR
ncbi:restriction endonuclease [Sphingomonas changnyeongensis]|uniref:Restriction endonuclease n=1 Tax=Sphingomonas changnyeongensis TaxID=2698679 RepID=A0A7Z2S9D2_9SPHN|nr:HNH endonuclease [Sphingomonas changnyeongensis]QHL91632.1 restriction endonuclease [Sphingomonas changnyeongensis]